MMVPYETAISYFSSEASSTEDMLALAAGPMAVNNHEVFDGLLLEREAHLIYERTAAHWYSGT